MGVSQEDIDNITEGEGAESAPPPAGADVLGKYREGFGTHLSNIFATLTGMEVSANVKGDEITDETDVASKLTGDWFGFTAKLEAGVILPTGHLMSLPVASLIAAKMMGVDEPPAALEEAQLGALKEVGGNLMGAWATGLGEITKQDAKTLGDPDLLEADIAAALAATEGFAGDKAHIWRYSITVDSTEGEYVLVLPDGPLSKLAEFHPEHSVGGDPVADAGVDQPDGGKKEVEVEKAVFQDFEGDAGTGTSAQIELLLDVPLTVSVELGRKKLVIKEILDMIPGSLLELDKLAGEPVDLMVNGKLFAQGEVVVIDENFGVRISSIVSPKERLERLK